MGPEAAISTILSQHLACFHGIVAVGTACGHVYLLGKNLYHWLFVDCADMTAFRVLFDLQIQPH
jgi:hypothetical protein